MCYGEAMNIDPFNAAIAALILSLGVAQGATAGDERNISFALPNTGIVFLEGAWKAGDPTVLTIDPKHPLIVEADTSGRKDDMSAAIQVQGVEAGCLIEYNNMCLIRGHKLTIE